MADTAALRRAVIEWFKNDFSEEARATTRTARLSDGSLSYNFSVTNTSGMNFDNFAFQVKVIDRDSDAEIGTAAINAGQWKRGDRKNFKSRLVIPNHVRNISFVMFSESIDFAASEEGTVGVFGELFGNGGMPGSDITGAARPAQPRTMSAADAVGTAAQSVGKAAQSVGKAAQTFSQKKLEKKLNKKRLGKSGWIIAGIVTAIIFLMASGGSEVGSADQIMFGGVGVAAALATLIAKLVINSKAKRIRTYETKVNKTGNTSMDDLCSYVGRPFEKVADDLHQMIVDGFFPDSYVDVDNRLLVMTKDGKPIEDVARSAAMNKKAKRKAARDGGAVPESLDDLITMTDDAEIKGKLKSLRTITKKIDARVEQVPELEKQVTDYREKYYPEVVRLTDEFNEKIVDMGKYGEENPKAEVTESADGSPVLNTNPNYLQEQAAEIKTQLISLIDSVTEASENLLEKLHEDDIMDITTDIKMLQTTLASKGLLDSDFDLN